MRTRPAILLAALAAAPGAPGHEAITTKLTWTQEISRIFYKRCVSCHRQGGRAMALMEYDEVRPWAKAIREEVLERRMPPWGAVTGVGDFLNDPSLTRPEIEMIVSWAEGGAPKGDDLYLPRFPAAQPKETERKLKTKALVVRSASPLMLDKPVTAASIRADRLPAGASMEVTAYRPDGGVDHLIWLRDFHEEWVRDYEFRDPVKLPKGTRITVYAPETASAILRVAE